MEKEILTRNELYNLVWSVHTFSNAGHCKNFSLAKALICLSFPLLVQPYVLEKHQSTEFAFYR